jgi:hypothetical protein
VRQKAKVIFRKKYSAVEHNYDEYRRMQDVAIAFHAELIANTSVIKQDGNYFIALRIQNIKNGKAIYSKSLTCEKCNAVQVMDKFKELAITAPVASQVPVDSPHVKEIWMFKVPVSSALPGISTLSESKPQLLTGLNPGNDYKISLNQAIQQTVKYHCNKLDVFVNHGGHLSGEVVCNNLKLTLNGDTSFR